MMGLAAELTAGMRQRGASFKGAMRDGMYDAAS